VHGGWAAASEIKALFLHPSLSPQLDRSVLGRSLATRYLAGPRTAFANVRRLPPGHYAWIDGASCEVRPYWRPPAPAPLALRAADIPDAVRAHLTTAVARCLVSDVPLGALLSGGLDSSIVVAASRRAGWGSLRTYTVGFDPPHSDERAAARRVAAHFDTVHTEIVVSLDAAALLDDVVWHLDEPMGDAAALPTLLICRAARSQVTVVLSGEGADELFLGYPRYALSRLADHARFLPRPLRRALFATAARLLPGRAATACARLADAPADPLLRSAVWMSGTSPRTVAALCRLPLEGWESWYLGEPDGRPSDSGHTLAAVLEHDLQAWLADDVLLKLDRMSMAASLEARAPFLDRDLVEFVCHLPTDLRFSHRGKAWLRQAFAADLPRASARRPKHPFRPPVAAWMRGRLGIALRDRMSRPGSFTREHLDPGVARNLLLEHQGGADHSLLLWSLLVHEAWWDRFFRHGAGG
jgi:asparagine synthase (glutamine-hydrolysing)